ncbi:MAG: hypothetical protein ACWGPS_02965 [Candidatus Promineifilaceae bacterium]
MDAALRELVQQIHDTPGRLMFVTAGAGAQALAWLLGVAGASRTLLEALIPYDASSFIDFLGQQPDQHVSEQTAGLLAGRAIVRARHLYSGGEPLIGLACTATIVTDRPKKGQHRAHAAAWTAERVIRHDLILLKGARDRSGEEDLVSRLVLNVLAEAYGLRSLLALPLTAGDQLETATSDIASLAKALLASQLEGFTVQPDGLVSLTTQPCALLSGAFNPLHEGHLRLAETAADILGCPVTFELAAMNAGKPTLSQPEILDRLTQFAGGHAVMVSAAALFSAKARLCPNTTFVVGLDTAERVLDPRYYHDSRSELLQALAEIRDRGCRFLVAGRTDQSGHFREASELQVPEPFHSLFSSIPGHRFRHDISSTILRQQLVR